jgi:glutamate-1-semialdehyde 2,1-aminomutase
MELFSPERGGILHHSGTFNGNALAMVAGIAALKLLTPAAIARINSLGEMLARRLEEIFNEAGIPGQVTGAGSLQHIHFTPEEVVDYRSALTSNEDAARALFFSLLHRGVFLSPRGMFCTSTPMDRKIASELVEKTAEAVDVLRAVAGGG